MVQLILMMAKRGCGGYILRPPIKGFRGAINDLLVLPAVQQMSKGPKGSQKAMFFHFRVEK